MVTHRPEKIWSWRHRPPAPQAFPLRGPCIRVNFTFELLDCDRYIGDIVILQVHLQGDFAPYITVTLVGLKKVNRYIENIVMSKIVIPGFHCTFYYRFKRKMTAIFPTANGVNIWCSYRPSLNTSNFPPS